MSPATHVVGQAEIADADLGASPGGASALATSVNASPAFSAHAAFGEFLDPDLRPRQVGEDADLDAQPLRRLAHRLRARDLRRWIAVREIQPHHVDAGAQQRIEHAGRIGGRAEGGEDAGASAML